MSNMGPVAAKSISRRPIVIPSQGDAQCAEHACEESLASLRILGRKWEIPRWRVANAPLARNDNQPEERDLAIVRVGTTVSRGYVYANGR